MSELKEDDWKNGEEILDRKQKKNAVKVSFTLEQKVQYIKKLMVVSAAYARFVSESMEPLINSHEQATRQIQNGVSHGATLIQQGQQEELPNNGRNHRSVSDSGSGIPWNGGPENEISDLFEGTLKDYQVMGFRWLKMLYQHAANGILADEMGLGKTVQCITMIAHLISKSYKGPFLIIAPLSTLPNWCAEFKKFCPKIPVLLFHGTIEERRVMKKGFKIQNISGGRKVYPVLITSYEVIMYEIAFISSYVWRYLVVDEGHRLKNRHCRLGKNLAKVQSKNRLLLTGTPLQNNLEELWSLLNFLTPEVFGGVQEFDMLISSEDLDSNSILEQEMKEGIISKLHKALRPFILRRMKNDVNLNLPPKKEILVYCPMTQLQWELYNATMDHTINKYLDIEKNEELPLKRKRTERISLDSHFADETEEGFQDWLEKCQSTSSVGRYAFDSLNKFPKDKDGNPCLINVKMQNPVFQLRKIANHPYLVQMPIDSQKRLMVDEGIIKKSGKIMMLDTLLPHLKQRGHKVLLFSTMTKILDIIEAYLEHCGYLCSRLDGEISLSNRFTEINTFMSSPDVFIFLISTRAGSLGLNLTSADTVIIFDSDWNPQVDLQAQDRCHRIGQTKPVLVYRFITTGSIDEKILMYGERKRHLEKIMLYNDCYKGDLNSNQDSQLTLEELKSLLSSKDYSKVVNTGSKLKMSKQEIEDLLDRSDM